MGLLLIKLAELMLFYTGADSRDKPMTLSSPDIQVSWGGETNALEELEVHNVARCGFAGGGRGQIVLSTLR